MGAYFLIVNPVKREYLDPARFGEDIKFSGLLLGELCCLAFKELISDAHAGDWVGDPVILASDDTGAQNPGGIATCTASDLNRNLSRMAREEFKNVSYREIASIARRDDVARKLVERAATTDYFLIDVIHVTFQYKLPNLEFAIRDRFGKDWRREFESATRLHPWRQPLPAIDP